MVKILSDYLAQAPGRARRLEFQDHCRTEGVPQPTLLGRLLETGDDANVILRELAVQEMQPRVTPWVKRTPHPLETVGSRITVLAISRWLDALLALAKTVRRRGKIMPFDNQRAHASPTGASLNLYTRRARGTARGIVQINHGLAEHAARYARFADALAARRLSHLCPRSSRPRIHQSAGCAAGHVRHDRRRRQGDRRHRRHCTI